MIELLSWVGLVLCIGAFFIKNVFYLRLVTAIGCSLLFLKYWTDDVPQGYIGNGIIIAINVAYLIKMYYNKQSYQAGVWFKRNLSAGKIKKITLESSSEKVDTPTNKS